MTFYQSVTLSYLILHNRRPSGELLEDACFRRGTWARCLGEDVKQRRWLSHFDDSCRHSLHESVQEMKVPVSGAHIEDPSIPEADMESEIQP